MQRPDHEPARPPEGRSGTSGLLGDAMDHVSNLVRGELDLFRAEIQENLTKALTAMGLLVGAVVVFLVALNVLAAAIVAGLTEAGLDAGWSALIVGGLLALIGIGMAFKGKSALSLVSLAPTRTTKNIRRDAEMIKEEATDGR